MTFNKVMQYHALLQRDRRYDGIFYFGVKRTGIYCRPSCSKSHPSQKNCAFFDTVQKAEMNGYHACKLCHPNRLKNGLSVKVLGSIDSGELNDKGVHGLADSLHISERHLRRIVQDRTGTSPLRLNKTRRLNEAKLLITKTKLSITDIAFNTEFSSLRQFNASFKDTFKTSPSEMRKDTQ